MEEREGKNTAKTVIENPEFRDWAGEKKREEYERQVLETALRAGQILLGNGAEIFRVEETIFRICRHYGVTSVNTFVLTNGIFLSAGNGREPYYSTVRHIPAWVTRLDKITEVNQLSREIEDHDYSIEEVSGRLDEIEAMEGRKKLAQIAVAGTACACFSFLFGGGPGDMAADFLTGLILYGFLLYGCGGLSKITGNLLCGGLITVCCIAFYHAGLGQNLRPLVMGAILPLVPGMSFTNAIRDLADGDYISGAVRMLDAVLVFMSVGAGTGAVFLIYHHLLGGVLL